MGITLTGGGTMILAGSNTYTGGVATTVSNGTMQLAAGGVINNNDRLIVTANSPAFNLSGGSLITSYNGGSGVIFAGSNNGEMGTINLDSGLISVSNPATTVTMGNHGNAAWNQTGGTATLAGAWWQANWGDSTATTSVSGGLFSVAGLMVLAERGVGTLNVSGSGAVSIGTLAMAGVSNAAQPGTATVNLLTGGTLTAGVISNYPNNTSFGTATFNFNGGVLQPSGDNASFMSGLSTTWVTAAVNVQENGAIINTNGFNITIGQPLLHSGVNPTDGGLTVLGGGVLN